MKRNVIGCFCLCFLVILPCVLFAQYTNVRVSSTLSNDPEEVTIAINPADPLNLAAGANVRYYYYSKNGGASWIEGSLSSTYGVWGDPSVAFDLDGNLYFAHLSGEPPLSGRWIDRIVVQKSTNGGGSWNNGSYAGLNRPHHEDKEWIVADLTQSPYSNNLYMAWTEFDWYGSANPADSSRILFSRSTDAGDTWSPTVRISDHGGNCFDDDNTTEGAVPAVGPNGEVYVSWSGPLGIMFDRSFDGGVTFGTDIPVTNQPGGWAQWIWGIYRCNGMPVTLCDISNSPYRGTVYIVWSDQRNGSDNTDVFIIKSTDHGETWGEVKRVNDDNSGYHQFFPWACVDPLTGVIYVVFYDRRNASGPYDTITDVYVSKSYDGGETFENFNVGESSFTTLSSVFFGDYINIAARNGKVYPIWTRMGSSGELSVWTALITDTVATKVIPDNHAVHQFVLNQNYPNPFNHLTQISYHLEKTSHVCVRVFNNHGQEVAVLVDESQDEGSHTISWDATGFSSGIYYYRIVAGEFRDMKKCILIK